MFSNKMRMHEQHDNLKQGILQGCNHDVFDLIIIGESEKKEIFV